MRYERRHRQKKRFLRRFLAVFVLLVAGITVYSFFQYQQGVNQSEERMGNQEKVEYSFSGQEDQKGGTNILLLGSDARDGENSRADTIMIAHHNGSDGTYKLTSIMRDCYVDIPGHGRHKINRAFAVGGPELMRQTIKENFGLDLQYYAIIDFRGFVALVDEAFPEGVEINVEKRMAANIGVTLEPGLQRLNGKQLLGYVRFRHDAVGDFGRVERQQKVVSKVGKDLASIETLPKLPKLVGVVTPFINTNMGTGNMLFMAKDFLGTGGGQVETLRIPVEGSWWNERTSEDGEILAIDIEKNRQALQDFIPH